ncbi:uncharacterized protein MELLADRAFT_108644 [Melampsora larici-populina 98AG31]|uniref:Co-chaperone HscB C-terminal oligomerisation domain-containing protein n=1 Tax=Melampsora larici-populina (strain 98AG31 / pathotype 3-4-7) TaxID=747676 RepID=F4RTS7_MELLP|nr:uncharacterized protein MELLADRAFT_108644 [Melampsora larici-populina 98AG31]EGG04054.1 hypothetical protein MELLADRAFT_108644 [Melampsora larici-populina 98AG31]
MTIKQLLSCIPRLHPRLRLRSSLIAVPLPVPFESRPNLQPIPPIWPISTYPHLRHITNQPNIRCPECGANSEPSSTDQSSSTSKSICHRCESFLPLTVAGSHFSLFGLPKTYRLDRPALRLKYHQWQQLVHPDLIAGRQNTTPPPLDRSDLNRISQAELASQWSILVNQARATLEDDVKRAAYMVSTFFCSSERLIPRILTSLLRALKLELDGRLSMPDESGDKSVDPNLLMTLMESHEQLEEAKTEVEVIELQNANKQFIPSKLIMGNPGVLEIIQETVLKLEQLWNSDRQLDIQTLERARALAIKLRYLETIDHNCREWRPPIR